MNKSVAKIEKKYGFTSFEQALKRKLKNRKFRTAFTEEMGRLELAQKLQTLRKHRRMTQKQVAERAHMPQSVIARVESGTHSFSIATLHRMASVFDKRIALVD